MDITSILSPRNRENPQIFSNNNNQSFTKTSFNDSINYSMNYSTSQPKIQLSSTQSVKVPQQYDSKIKTETRPISSLLPQTFQRPQSQLDKSVEISLLKIENKNLKQENQKLTETVGKLRTQLTQKVSTLQKFNDLMKIKYAQIKTLKAELETNTKKITELENQKGQNISSQQAQRIKQQYMLKSAQLDQLLAKINNLQHENFTNELFQMKISKLYDQLDEEKSKSSNLLIQRSQLNQKIYQLKERVESLQYDNQKIVTVDKCYYQSEQIQKLFASLNDAQLNNSVNSSPTKQSKQSQHLNAFEEALKVQLKQIQQLKKTIENSQEIIQSLKDNLITSRRQLQELRAQMKIINLKQSTERKKLIMEYRLQLHQKDNQINNSFKKYKTLDEKYKTALNDIKAKDDFLKQHLLGRLTDITAQQYVDSVLKKYTQNFEQLVDLKTQNAQLTQKSQKYLKYEQQIETGLLDSIVSE